MNKWRKLICFFIGHRSICIFTHHWQSGGYGGSEITNWKCERCGHTFTEQWDT